MIRPGFGDPLAEDASELIPSGGPDAVHGVGGGVEVDVIDVAAAELIGLLLDGQGIITMASKMITNQSPAAYWT
jgi:hypothetical protein